MEKALAMGKTSVTGSFHLLIGVAASTVIMAVGTIILTRLMSPAEYGVYAIALIPSLLINLFRDWGVNSAITKYVANLRATNKEGEIRDVIVAGVIFEVTVGLALSLLSVFLAGFIASALFHRPETASYIAIISITILSGALLSVAQSAFIGFERMRLNSLTLICQSIVKTLVGPILVILGYGVLGAVLGYSLSVMAAGIFGITILYFMLFRHVRKSEVNSRNLLKMLAALLKFGVPLSMSSMLGGILIQINGFIMASFISDANIGNYQAAVNFSVLLTFVTIPISTVLFPAFAKLNPQKESALLKTVFVHSIKYTSILVLPATMAVMALSGPMISTLFGEKYTSAPFFLTFYLVINLFAVIGSLSSQSLMTGLGETGMLLKLGILNLLIGLPLSFLLIPSLGIVGLITAGIFCNLPCMFWGLYWIWKKYGVKADFRSSARIFIASALAASASFICSSVLNTASWIRLIVGITIFLATYILIAPMIGAVNLTDIDNLRAMSSGMSFVSRIVNIPLKIVEKALLVKTSRKKEKSSDTKS